MNTRPLSTLAVLLALLLHSSGWSQATEKQIAELEEEIAALEEKISALEEGGGEVARLLGNVETAKAEMAKTKADLAAEEKEAASEEFLLSAYQSAFRVVTTFSPGQALEPFHLANGELVASSTFVGTTKGAITVQTSGGVRTIALEQLPESFRDRVKLPPRTAPLPTNLAAVLATKPEFLKSAEELATAREPAPSSTTAGSGGGAASAGTDPAAADPGRAEMEAKQRRNDERQRQINELKLQLPTLFAQKKSVRDEKSNLQQTYRQATIKKSGTEMNNALSRLDDKIRSIEAEETRLRQEISRLQTQFE